MISGWLFDVYPLNDKIILWIKNKKTHRIEINWTPSVYVASNTRYKLDKLWKNSQIKSLIKNHEWTKKIEKAYDLNESTVLKLSLKNSFDLLKLGKIIEGLDEFGVYRLYNVDVPPAQTFMYENDLFPLGKYDLDKKWIPQSDIAETNYKLPSFTKINLQVNAEPTGKRSLKR